MQPWIRKYLPSCLKEVQGQDTALEQLKSFILNFEKQKKKAALVYGPTGSGKTSSVYALAYDLNKEILEINASDVRNKQGIEEVVGTATKQQSLFGKGKIILVDEVDGLSSKDRGGVATIAKIISNTSFPVIMTITNPWDRKFSPIRMKSVLIQFKTLAYTSVSVVLEKICEKEKIKYNIEDLRMLARLAGGDLRAAINDLQSLAQSKNILERADLDKLSQREQIESVMNALIKIFKNSDPKIAIDALNNVEEDLDKVILWIDENLPKEYTKPEDLARAYSCLADADVFKGRIRRWQHWRFLVYINALVTAGIAASKDEKYQKFVSYKPTTRILKIWMANMKYLKRKAIAQKIAKETHCSTKRALRDMPYLQVIFQKNEKQSAEIAECLDLDNEEIEWLKK